MDLTTGFRKVLFQVCQTNYDKKLSTTPILSASAFYKNSRQGREPKSFPEP